MIILCLTSCTFPFKEVAFTSPTPLGWKTEVPLERSRYEGPFALASAEKVFSSTYLFSSSGALQTDRAAPPPTTPVFVKDHS